MGGRDHFCQTSSSLNNLLNTLFSYKRGEKSGLDSMRLIDEAQGHLHKTFRSIHVGGTNGKGSVCHKIAAALKIAGYKVGLYTSPHLFSFSERIRVNGKEISEEAILRLLPQVMRLHPKASFFDYTTALAFAYFAEEKVDYAVIEVGIGGRFDSTNVITPVLSIITSIDYDHTHLLGSTLEEIVHEKAGIIKPNIPYVLARSVPILEGFRAEAGKTDFYDDENSFTAKLGLEMLNISPAAIEEGILMRPPCRFEIFHDKIVLDVAHNPDAIKKLIKAAKHHFPHKKFHFIVGFSKDKDAASCLLQLNLAGKITCVGGFHPRLWRAEELGEIAKSFGIEVKLSEKILLDATDPNEIVIICGSFYLMSAARECLEVFNKRHSIFL